MSPRAACRLATLGFTDVYDYVAGKADWLARGLPVEGTRAADPSVREFARDDVASCRLDERVGSVRSRVEASPFGFALVLSESGVLLGRLRAAALDGDPDALAGDVMEPGPSTIRPDTPPNALLERLRSRGLRHAIVTTPDGELVGVVSRVELEQAALA